VSRAVIDLSARPFVNRRPVVRLSLLLWLVGVLLLAGNIWLYWDFIAGRGNLHSRLRDVNEKIAIEERRISSLSGELASFDLAAQNGQVTYLNRRIGQRRFSWSGLFDELSDLLPRDVRLTSLAPSAEGDGRGRNRRTQQTDWTGTGRVELAIDAQARNDQAILDFVDALFADPRFERPNLTQQRESAPGAIDFNLRVYYLAGTPLEAEVIEMGDEAVPEDGGEIVSPEPGPGTSQPLEPATVRPAAPLGRPASSPPELS
jgi:Fimbrial assembly protein (PilN)